MSYGRKCNKAYWEMEAGITDTPCFYVYNGECLKDAGIPCPMPKMPKKTKENKTQTIKQ